MEPRGSLRGDAKRTIRLVDDAVPGRFLGNDPECAELPEEPAVELEPTYADLLVLRHAEDDRELAHVDPRHEASGHFVPHEEAVVVALADHHDAHVRTESRHERVDDVLVGLPHLESAHSVASASPVDHGHRRAT